MSAYLTQKVFLTIQMKKRNPSCVKGKINPRGDGNMIVGRKPTLKSGLYIAWRHAGQEAAEQLENLLASGRKHLHR